VGRADDQIQVRGHRVEPGEVEAALTRHPGVAEAVVHARGEGAERRLTGYVVPADPAAPPGEEALRAHLARTLPTYMIPTAFAVLDRVPLTPHGKTDRAALPEPGPRQAPDATYVPPRTDTERLVAEVWAEILQAPRVGAEDDFYALGGDSVRALLTAARIGGAVGVELTPGQVLTARTVAGLADLVEELVLSELEQAAAGTPAPTNADER
jgi:hypothetical protein